jgi:alpha-mannosidase
VASYEIQWGNVDRPTHRNTSWDWARFETAAQKWVDLSEGNYGVSLINDCKYGHDIHENVIRLTLLRGTTTPDPGADLGMHKFRYCLLPHKGKWGQETVKQAYIVNDPLIVFTPKNNELKRAGNPGSGNKLSKTLPPLIQVNQSNIIIETIKRAEDQKGIIVRLYEYQRGRGPFKLTAAFPIVEAWRTNILEEDQEEIATDGRELIYRIKPYQILTLRLIPKP